MLRPSLALAGLCLCLALPIANARRVPPSEGPLLELMEGLKEHLKGVAMGLQASDDAATLEHIAEMQRLVLLTKREDPSNLGEQPESKRDSHRAAFRRDLALVLGELAAMEVEVLDGERQEAFGRVTGALFRMREEAHERYQTK